MKRIKKVLAFLLATLMLSSSMPLSALADEIRYDDSGAIEDIVWSYTAATDTLYINSIGELPLVDNGAFPTYKGVYELVEGLKFSHVVIGKDVTAIIGPSTNGYPYTYGVEYHAYDFTYDVSFEEQSSLETIGDCAFDSSPITEITLPDNPELDIDIEVEAFYGAAYLRKVTMSDNVSSIGEGAFAECASLNEINLSNKITEIADSLFYNCSQLRTVNIPEGVTKICGYAFEECHSLEELSLPDSLTEIKSYAFYNCSSLRSITLPDNMTELESATFSGCTSLASIDLGKIKTIGGAVFDRCSTLPELVIPDSVTTIASRAFTALPALERVTIGRGVTSISTRTFGECTALREVNLPDTLKLIGSSAFSGCSALEEINIPDSVTTISSYAFSYCTNLKRVNFPDNLTDISNYAFRNCAFENLVIPEGVAYIGNYAFSGACSGSLTLSSTVYQVGAYAFAGCDLTSIDFGDEGEALLIDENAFEFNENLESLHFTPRVNSINSYAFSKCYSLYEVEFETEETEDGLQGIGYVYDHAFAETDIEELVFPASLEELGSYALANMEQLRRVDLTAASIYEIDSYTFSNDERLTEILLPDILITINDYGFANLPIQIFEIPDSVMELGKGAFQNTELVDITVPSTVNILGNEIFKDCKALEHIDLRSLKTIPNGICSGCTMLESVEMSDSVTTIGSYAFYNCTNLRIANLPTQLKKIDSYAFNHTKVDAPLPNYVSSVGAYAFADTPMKAANFVRPECTIGQYAFFDCKKLATVSLPTSLVRIEQYTFANTPIESITLPSKLTTISTGAFKNTNLKGITLPSTVKSIQGYAFADCGELKAIDYTGTSVTAVYANTFQNCSLLESVTLPNKCTNIYTNAFASCSSLATITIPETVVGIGASAFGNCPLDEITILSTQIPINDLNNSKIGLSSTNKHYNTTINGLKDSTVETYATSKGFKFRPIGYYDSDNSPVIDNGTVGNMDWFITGTELHIAGNGLWRSTDFYEEYMEFNISLDFSRIISERGITKLVVEEGVQSIPNELFANPAYDQSTLTQVSLPSTLTQIGSYAFASSNIQSIIIPDSVTSIGEYAFYQADLSQGATLGSGITSIPNYAFADTNLGSIIIPSQIRELGSYAFANTSLRSLNIPDNVTSVGSFVFSETDLSDGVTIGSGLKTISEGMFAGSNISSIELPSTIVTIESAAFLNCLSLTYIKVPSTVTVIHAGTRTTRPIGYTDRGVILTGLYMDVEPNSEALNYAQIYGVNHNEDYDEGVISGYYGDLSIGNIWYYYEDTKHMYLKLNGITSNNSLRRYDGTYISDGELDVDCLTVSGVTSIGSSNYYGPFSVINPKKIILPNDLKYISDNAFAGMSKVTTITIPNSVISIKNSAFRGCTSLKGIKFGNGINIIPSYLCSELNSLQAVEFGSGIERIEGHAFYRCTNLQSVYIPENVKYIGENAFAKCFGVINIENDSNALLTVGAFADLPLLEEIKLNSLFEFSEHFRDLIFSNDSTKERKHLTVTYGDDITDVDLTLFRTSGITDVNIGKNVNNIVAYDGYLPIKLNRITVSKENPYYFTYANSLYKRTSSDTSTLILAQNTKSSVSVMNGATVINQGAFYRNDANSIVLPDSVRSIGSSAFEGCGELKKIRMSTRLQGIGSCAFKNCTRLKTIDIPSASIIYDNAFEGCTNLSSVILPEVLKIVGEYVFKNCSSLFGIVIPQSTLEISSNSFNGCTELEELYIWDTTILGTNDKFADCPKLVIHTPVGTQAYAFAREYDIPYSAYIDRDIFYDLCAMKLDVLAGYLGFCDDGHGDIDYLTVYEASCDYDGYVIGVCEYCSEILEEIHTNATGHNYVVSASIPATETTQGMTKYICTNCDDTYYTYTPATGSDVQQAEITLSGTITIATSGGAFAGNVPVYGASIIVDGYKVATSDDDGKFSITLQTGVHEIHIRYSYGIERTVYVIAEDEDINYGAIPIIACDWDKNGVIDEEDIELFKLVISSKPTDPSYLRFVDLNGDNYINAKDMAIIRSCMKYNPTSYNSLVIQK